MGNLTTGLLSKSVVSFGLYIEWMNTRTKPYTNALRNKFHSINISINNTQFPKHLNPMYFSLIYITVIFRFGDSELYTKRITLKKTTFVQTEIAFSQNLPLVGNILISESPECVNTSLLWIIHSEIKTHTVVRYDEIEPPSYFPFLPSLLALKFEYFSVSLV